MRKRNAPMPRPAAIAVGGMIAALAGDAVAEPNHSERAPAVQAGGGADHGAHGSEHHLVIGAMGSYLAAIHGDEVHHYGGGGLLFEASLVPHWLELEYSVRALTDGHALLFPIDVLLKLPFHLSDTAVPFIGAGPTVIPAFVEGIEAHLGIATTAGVCFWLWSWGGLFAEANYNLVFEGDLVHEIGGNGGIGYRF